MCGIMGYIGSKQVVPVLVDGLRRLEYRGYDSAGVAVVCDGEGDIRRSAGKLVNLETAIANDPIHGEYGPGPTPGAPPGGPTGGTPPLTVTARAGSLSSTTASSKTTSRS